MNNTNLALQADIRPLERQDIAEATAVMKRAFDDDSRRHLNQETGGDLPAMTRASSCGKTVSTVRPAPSRQSWTG
ncbi:MAG TPA: hypothetical protein PLV73_10245 [Treponemataceae bacterium]|nr:hypothetical protein [Treponemataceae bacterium]